MHHWKETGETTHPGCDPRDSDALEKKLVLSGVTREEWWPQPGMHEVSFAMRVFPGTTNNGKRLRDNTLPETRLHLREYGPADPWKAQFDPRTHLTGSIDWVDLGGDETAYVDDLKTGRWPVHAETSKQLRSYALVPWILMGMPGAWDGLVSITQWPKYPLAGKPMRTYYTLTSEDLMEHLEAVRWAMASPDEVKRDEDACRFCNAKPNCPAWQSEDT